MQNENELDDFEDSEVEFNEQPDPQHQVTGKFADRFEDAYSQVTSGGWSTLAAKSLDLFLIISGAISYVWFARLMPGLILDPNTYPSAAPFVAGFIGVASMEGMTWIWSQARLKNGLSLPQLAIAWVGLFCAFVASGATTIAAVASAVGGSQDSVTGLILHVSGSGLIGYYVGFQIALAMLFGLVSVKAREALHTAKVSAKTTQASEKRAKAIADATLAAHVATLDDVRTVAKIGAYATHKRLINDMARKYDLTPDLAEIMFRELAEQNADMPVIDNESGGIINGARRFFGRGE